LLDPAPAPPDDNADHAIRMVVNAASSSLPPAEPAPPPWLALIGLDRVMALGNGAPDLSIGIVDGQVDTGHAALSGARFVALGAPPAGPATGHGTFVTGLLAARRGGAAPGICPDCRFLLRPVFGAAAEAGTAPQPSPGEIRQAVLDCLAAGARIINLSLGAAGASIHGVPEVAEAVAAAMARGAIVVTAAGNHGSIGGSALVRHAWALPVVACDGDGRPSGYANLAASIGRRGVMAPGEAITGLAPGGGSVVHSGTSFAAAIVTGALALLWSLAPHASAAAIRQAAGAGAGLRRAPLVPPLFNAEAALAALGVRA
jgi:subtilisin family serine protease